MSEIELTRRQTGTIRNLATGRLHHIAVRSAFQGHVLEMEDLHFHHNSAVVMPGLGDEPEDGKGITGLMVLAACYCHANQNPLQKLLIAGHTDTSGSDAYNLALSRLRANNVLALLVGDRARWVQISVQQNVVEDYQQILKYIAARWGWDCDPGSIDGDHGPATQAAIRRFQELYNQTFTATIAEDGTMGPQTWGAFFDVYERMLTEMLTTDSDGLSSLRNDLHFLDDDRKNVGCGENFPIDSSRQDNYRSSANRRVELLFFDPGEEPKLECHPTNTICTSTKCELYNRKMYRFKHIPVEVIPVLNRERFILIINEIGIPVAKRPVKLETGAGRRLVLVTDDEGKIYPFLREGEEVSVELQDIHEAETSDPARTPSGEHFAANQAGPAGELPA